MDTYQLNLSFSELDTLKASIGRTILDLEKLDTQLNDVLDNSPDTKTYNLYLGCLSNVTRDKNNMRSILSQAESIS
jgi:hypothetical protein